MKVTLSKNIGFCFGVKNAINVVKEAKIKYSDKKVFMHGPIVHNRFVMEQLIKELNIKLINNINDLPNNSVLVLPAHGHPKEFDILLKQKNIIVVDAICEKVKRNTLLIQNEIAKGHRVIYVGIKNHSEANAALSINSEIIFVNAIQPDLDFTNYIDKNKTYCVVFQTTLNILQLSKIIDELKLKISNLEVSKEICGETRIRQETIDSISPLDFDIVFIIGDSSSSNTTRLYEIALKKFSPKNVYMFNSLAELDISILKNKKSAYITSGTSTPNEIINQFYNALLNYNG